MVGCTVIRSASAIVLGLVIATSALGYQQPAHQWMTISAGQNSVLASNTAILPLLQCSGGTACSLSYVQDLMGQGAFDEDDDKRGLAHFFDAQNGGAPGSTVFDLHSPADAAICLYLLTFDLLSTSPCLVDKVTFTSKASSADWILSDTSLWQVSPFFHPDLPLLTCNGAVPEATSYCDYELAKNELMLALTASSPADRQSGSSQLFFNLGHVLHHIQDQAQPQHVRNDSHCDKPLCALFAQNNIVNGLGAPSAYEAYTGVLIPQNIEFFAQLAATGPLGALDVLPTTASNTPVFALPRDFWSTGAIAMASFGHGMSDFTSYNFFSIGTGPTVAGNSLTPDASHPQPSNFVTSPYLRMCTDLAEKSPGLQTYLVGSVTDQLGAGPASSGPYQDYSTVLLGTLPGPATQQPTKRWAVTQNCVTYDQAMYLLVPQAIRYSAWFIDFMFRGSISATLAADGTLSVTNNSKTEALSGGYFQLLADEVNGHRFPVNNFCHITVAIPPGATDSSCNFGPLPSVPPPSLKYLVVYNGNLGQETNQVAFTNVAAPGSWDANADFALKNPNGPWSYLQNRSPLMFSSNVNGLATWTNGGVIPYDLVVIKNLTNTTITQTTRVLQPGLLVMDPEMGLVAVSFTAPVAGTYTVTGKFTGADTGENGHSVDIVLNQGPLPLFGNFITSLSDSIPFNLQVTLAASDALYFQVLTGSSGACPYCNLSTGFNAKITLGH